MSTTPPIEPLVTDAGILGASAMIIRTGDPKQDNYKVTTAMRGHAERHMKALRALYEAERAELIRQRDEAVTELRNIANAKRFDKECFEDDTVFADWARSRANHTLSKVTLPSPPNR